MSPLPETVNVPISLSLPIDGQAWADEYGIDNPTLAKIVNDVRNHATNTLREHFGHLGLLVLPEDPAEPKAPTVKTDG